MLTTRLGDDGTLELSRKQVKLGRARFTLAPGKQGTVKVRVPRRLLGTGRNVRATATIG